jgi:hypothetical protein
MATTLANSGWTTLAAYGDPAAYDLQKGEVIANVRDASSGLKARSGDVVLVDLDWTSDEAGNRYWSTSWTPYWIALALLTVMALLAVVRYRRAYRSKGSVRSATVA